MWTPSSGATSTGCCTVQCLACCCTASPGPVVGPAEVDMCRRQSASLALVNVGPGTHFLPEDQPEAISRALAELAGTSL